MSFLAIALILPQFTWDKFEVKVIFRGVKLLIYIAFMVDRTEKRTKSEMSQWNVGVSDWEKKSRAKIAVFPRMLGLSQHFGNEFPLVYIGFPTFSVFRQLLKKNYKKILYIERE